MSLPEPESTLFGRESRPTSRSAPAAVTNPVARVVLDSSLAHIDRLFDYAVTAEMADSARPGVRVRVRWSGQLLDGFIVERAEHTEHIGELAPIERVVSAERVLTPHTLRTARAIADYYAGTLSDVLRLAIPPRHATVEKDTAEANSPAPTSPASQVDQLQERESAWRHYDAGAAFLRRLKSGQAPAAAWTAAPGQVGSDDWPYALAEAARAAAKGGRGSVLVVPDHRDVARVCSALDQVSGPDSYARLTADMGPGDRYRSWLSILRGQRRIVVGTRAASYAPVADLGLVAIWDDSDDALREPRSPYPHTLEIGRIRATDAEAALLVGGYARSVAVEQLVSTGSLRAIEPNNRARAAQANVVIAGEGFAQERDSAARVARIPSLAWRVAKEGLQRGPVLVQVPRRGYGMGVSCAQCRTPVHCSHCQGPTVLTDADQPPHCRWCAQDVWASSCNECGSRQRRVAVVGDRRTAEEIGRAFPGIRVWQSRLGQVIEEVDGSPAIVIATPGAEPVARGGYAAALLLDGWALLDRPGLESSMEANRRWINAAALVKKTTAKAQIVLAGVPAHGDVRSVEAMARWAPGWLARTELAERLSLGLPPAQRVATVTGQPDDVAAATRHLESEHSKVTVLGPLPLPDRTGAGQAVAQAQTVWRVADADPAGAEIGRTGALVEAVRQMRVRESMKRTGHGLLAVLDPADLAT